MPSDKDLRQWIRDVYKKGADAGLHLPSVKAFADHLLNGVEEGFGVKMNEIDFDSPDYHVLYKLRKDVFHFSAAKNHSELRALTGAVVSNDGSVRSFDQFKKQAAKITGQFRGPWLQAEYNLAVAGGQMSSKWAEFEQTGDKTMLRYSTVKDARVSNICKPLEGVTKPIGDKFWDTYYPPNHFNCRCDVDRVPYSASETTDNQIAHPDIPKMMRTNLAKNGLIFPPEHVYYNGLKELDLIKFYRSELMTFAEKELIGKSTSHPVLGEIKFTVKGIKKILSQYDYDKYDQLFVLYQINDLMGKSIIETQNIIEDSSGKSFGFYYLDIKSFNGNQFRLNVRKNYDNTLELYTINRRK